MVDSGPTISIPHWEKGQGLGMEIRSCTGDFRMGASRWQQSHFFGMIGSVGFHGRLIVPLSVSPVCQSFAAWMVSTYSLMYFSQHIMALFGRQTFQILIAQGSFEQLTIDKGKSG